MAYVSGQAALTARWAGFAEPCSGVRSYRLELLAGGADASNALPVWSLDVAGGASTSSAGIPASVLAANMLSDGAAHHVRVVATSHAGLSSGASAPLTADATPPGGGTISASLGACDEATVSWSGFTDAASGVASVRWKLGTTYGGDDLLAEVAVGGASGAGSTTRALTFDDLPFAPTAIYSTLLVADAAGLVNASVRALSVPLFTCNATRNEDNVCLA